VKAGGRVLWPTLAGLPVLVALCVLSACSQGPGDGAGTSAVGPTSYSAKSSPSTTVSSSSRGSSSASRHHNTPVGSTPPRTAPRSSSSGYLEKMEQATLAASQTTFQATYTGSDNSTMTFAQMGSRTAFSTGSTAYYRNGSADTVCDIGNTKPVCYTGAQPLQGVLSLVSPASTYAAIQAVVSGNVSVNHTTQDHGVQCLAYTFQSQSVKYCVDQQGIVSYIGIQGGNYKLTKFTADVSEASVSVPSNAVVNP
jgi:hypothetical protein